MPKVGLDTAFYWVTIACLVMGLFFQNKSITNLEHDFDMLKNEVKVVDSIEVGPNGEIKIYELPLKDARQGK